MYSRVLPALLIAILFLTSASLTAQDSTSVDTLVAYYPFNGNASDSSGFGNDGEIFGASLTEDRFGNQNNAYSFDGISDFIEIPDDSTFTSPTKTIEFWFNKTNDPTKTTGDGLIWKSFNTSAIRDYSFMLTREEGSFGLYNAVSNGSDASVYTWMDRPIYADRWYHVVGIVDTSSNSLYVNGEHIVTVEHDGEVINHGAPITIGKASVNSLSTRFFKGTIDDIKIYNYVLSDSAIIESFTEGDWPPPPPPIDSTGTVNDVLVAHYSFDGNAADSSGFGNDGEVFGAELTEDRFERMDSAYYFDGSDYIDFGSSDTIEFAREDFSISVWVKPTSSGKSQYQILRKGPDVVTDGEARWSLGLDEIGKIRMVFEDADQGDSTLVLFGEKNLLDDKWHHIGVVFDRDSTLRIFVDNEEEISSGDIKGYSGYITNQEEFSLYAGRANSDASQFSFVGNMDDIQIYSYALEDSAIGTLYSEGGWPLVEEVIPDTLVAHYPFNGSASDSSGFGNDGQVFGPILAEDRFGNLNSAYAFDGFNDYIEIPDDLVFTSPTKTIEFWFNKTNDPTKTTGDGLIWKSFGTSAIRDYSFMLTREEGSFGLYNAVSNGSDASVYTWMDSPIYADRWYHVVGVIDTSSNSLYVNGEHIVTVEHDGEVINHGAPITIGKASVNSLSTRFFKGSIDDIKIYNYVLSDSAIIESFTEGDWPPPPPPIDSTGTVNDVLVAHYSFDGNAADSSGFGNDGEVFGAELTEDRFERMDSAYYFDGSDYIDFGSSDTIEFAREDFSISVWVKPTSSGKSQYQILRKGPDVVTDGEARWSLGLDEIGKIRMVFEDADQGDSTLVLFGEKNLLDDKWHHIGVVFDRDSTLRIFVDNEEEISSGDIKGYSGYITNQEEFSLYAGRANSDASQFSFVGNMDDIQIYSYALEDSAIDNLYSEGGWPIDSTGTSDEVNDFIPGEYLLYQNYPNPFNPSTTIKFDLPESSVVTLKVFDITGRLVATLIDGTKIAGRYQANFNASNLASGIYLYELRTNKFSSIKKFTLIK